MHGPLDKNLQLYRPRNLFKFSPVENFVSFPTLARGFVNSRYLTILHSTWLRALRITLVPNTKPNYSVLRTLRLNRWNTWITLRIRVAWRLSDKWMEIKEINRPSKPMVFTIVTADFFGVRRKSEQTNEVPSIVNPLSFNPEAWLLEIKRPVNLRFGYS